MQKHHHPQHHRDGDAHRRDRDLPPLAAPHRRVLWAVTSKQPTPEVTAHTLTLAVTRPCEITVAFRSHAGSGRFSNVSTAA